MKKISLPPIIIALFLISCFAQSAAAQTPRTKISEEEYAVYSAVINKMFAGGKVTFDTQSKVKLLIVADRNITTLRAFRPESVELEMLPELTEETLNDFVRKNEDRQKLKDNFTIELKRTFIKKEAIEDIFKDREKGWEKFYQRFPDSGGYIGLSRVGFDKEKKQAIVYMEHYCHDLCASGHFLLLKKSKKGWETANGYRAWIS